MTGLTAATRRPRPVVALSSHGAPARTRRQPKAGSAPHATKALDTAARRPAVPPHAPRHRPHRHPQDRDHQPAARPDPFAPGAGRRRCAVSRPQAQQRRRSAPQPPVSRRGPGRAPSPAGPERAAAGFDHPTPRHPVRHGRAVLRRTVPSSAGPWHPAQARRSVRRPRFRDGGGDDREAAGGLSQLALHLADPVPARGPHFSHLRGGLAG